MYVNGEPAKVGDIVQGSGGDGEVLQVIPNGVVSGGVEDALVQWFAVYEVSPGYKSRKAPVQVATQSLTFVRRKS
jgi:hypothetical protein